MSLATDLGKIHMRLVSYMDDVALLQKRHSEARRLLIRAKEALLKAQMSSEAFYDEIRDTTIAIDEYLDG